MLWAAFSSSLALNGDDVYVLYPVYHQTGRDGDQYLHNCHSLKQEEEAEVGEVVVGEGVEARV